MKKLIACVVLSIISIFAPLRLSAGQRDVVVVLSENILPFREIADNFSRLLKERRGDIQIEQYLLNEDPAVLEKVKSRNPALIFTVGTYATEMIIKENIPSQVVFAGISEPQESDIISQSAAVGVTLDVPIEAQLNYLKRVIPGLKSLGIIYHPAENERIVQKIKTIANNNGLELKLFPVSSPGDINKIGRLDIGALLIIPDSVVCQPKAASVIIMKSVQDRIPSVGISAAYAQSGTCFAISSDYADAGLQSAEIGLKILNGENSSRLGIIAPRKVNYFLNKTVARRLGVNVPPEVAKEFKEVFGK